LHDSWGVGHADCNNGIVLVLSELDRHMFFSTGAGVKGIVTDKLLDYVIEQMRGSLRAVRRLCVGGCGASIRVYWCKIVSARTCGDCI
jgi:hypothetical protein